MEKEKEEEESLQRKGLYKQVYLNGFSLNCVTIGFSCLITFLMPNIYLLLLVSVILLVSLGFIYNHSLQKFQC